MVRVGRFLLGDAGSLLGKTLSDVLVCPLSKQPLRLCEKTNSLISDAIGVSFPIKDGIPCLVPTEGRIIENEEAPEAESSGKSRANDRKKELTVISMVRDCFECR